MMLEANRKRRANRTIRYNVLDKVVWEQGEGHGCLYWSSPRGGYFRLLRGELGLPIGISIASRFNQINNPKKVDEHTPMSML